MSYPKHIPEAQRLEVEKREMEHLLRISARAQGVMAECKQVLAARYQDLNRNNAEAEELASLLRS